ncbi:hypothetical protein IU447_16745 [Nocardia farcinica]|uniref:hypothetical protein n=1 Tax=Nocardia farcinica TaxID=37329 RepID=UPI0018951B67|nr:hypothetical protein [Nocardia farcinica]MBF6361762.1 hypothetical protein [Nocardia farcinica]
MEARGMRMHRSTAGLVVLLGSIAVASCGSETGPGSSPHAEGSGVTERQICEYAAAQFRDVWGEKRELELLPLQFGSASDRVLGAGGIGVVCQFETGDDLYATLAVRPAKGPVDRGQREVTVAGTPVQVSWSNLIRPHFETVLGDWHAALDIRPANSDETFVSPTDAQAQAGAKVLVTVLERAAS